QDSRRCSHLRENRKPCPLDIPKEEWSPWLSLFPSVLVALRKEFCKSLNSKAKPAKHRGWRASLPLLGSNQDSPDPESGVLPVTPRGSAPKIAAFSAPRIPHRRERGRDLLETRGIIDGGRHAILDAIGNLLDRAAEDLTRARLRQTLHHD